jgi:hypothetical protein
VERKGRGSRNDLLLSDPTQDAAAAALSQMLRMIETELAEEKLEAADERRLRRRAESIRTLLVPRLIT